MEVGLQVPRGPGGAGSDDEPQARLVQGLEIGRGEHAGVGDDDELLDLVGPLEGLHDGDDRGGLGPIALPAPDSQGEAAPVDQQADDDLGVDPPLLGVAHPPQVVLTLGLEVQGGHVVQTQRQAPAGGGVLEESPGEALTPAPLDAAAQGAEQGPHTDRLQAQVAQNAGNLLLGCRLDHTSQDHLLEGPITTGRLAQPQAGVGPVQNVPQQPGALGLHHDAVQAGAPRRRLQGLQVQEPLTLLGGDPPPPNLHQGRQLGVVVGRPQVLHDPAHTVLLGNDLHGRRPRGGLDLAQVRAHTGAPYGPSVPRRQTPGAGISTETGADPPTTHQDVMSQV